MIEIKLHLITPEHSSCQTLISTIPMLQDQFDRLHLRLHHQSDQEIMDLVNELRNRSFPDEKLIIHDRPHLVDELGLTHVQVGFRSPKIELIKKRYPTLQIGVSVHSLTEVLQAKEADFLLLGHIYPTASKSQKEPLGIYETEQIVRMINKPVIAIGGIKPIHVPSLHQIGIKGVAVMSGVLGANHPTEALAAYNRARRELDV